MSTQVYTVTRAAEKLGLSRQRVHQVIKRLELGTRQGRIILLTEDDLEAIRNRPDWRAVWGPIKREQRRERRRDE